MTAGTTAIRWMWVWITLAVLIVLVVIGFLLAIADALESIEEGLDEAQSAVVGARGDVKPLPAHIQDVNTTLGRVDAALQPIPRQAERIVGELGSVRSTLYLVDGSLVDTERSLKDTAVDLDDTAVTLVDVNGSLGRIARNLDDTEVSLADTSGELGSARAGLVRTRRLTSTIQARLKLAQGIRTLGTGGIWRRVRFLNGGLFVPDRPPNRRGLRAIERDADAIDRSLFQVNKHLTSICHDLRIFAAFSEGRC